MEETESPVTTTRSSFDAVKIAKGLAWDVGPALVAYYGLHLLGVGDFVALLTATVAAGLRTLWGVLWERSLNLFSAVIMLVFGIGLALTFITGDPRLLLVKGSVMAAAGGVALLVTAVRGRPLILAAQQRWDPARAEEIAEEYRTDPRVRHVQRVSSAVWGTTLVVEATLRIPLIYLLPVSVMVGLSMVFTVVTFSGLIAWNSWYITQSRRRAQHSNALT